MCWRHFVHCVVCLCSLSRFWQWQEYLQDHALGLERFKPPKLRGLEEMHPPCLVILTQTIAHVNMCISMHCVAISKYKYNEHSQSSIALAHRHVDRSIVGAISGSTWFFWCLVTPAGENTWNINCIGERKREKKRNGEREMGREKTGEMLTAEAVTMSGSAPSMLVYGWCPRTC